MHRSITTLQAAGLPIREFPQTQANCTRMGQPLFDLLTGQNLTLYQSDELRQQAPSTVSIETPRGWRIAKEKASKKIDAIVAAAMAAVSAMEHRREIASRAAGGFDRNVHVAKDKLAIVPHAPVFIGQVFEVPATVVAQVDGTAIRVLMAAANEDMSLKHHCEEILSPWLGARVPHKTILGTYEAISDGAVEYYYMRDLKRAIPGVWWPAVAPWET